jgi:hypothetical protein
MSLATIDVSAKLVKKAHELVVALVNCSSIRFRWLERGTVILESDSFLSLDTPSKWYVTAIDMLAEIEEKLGLDIIIPDRDFTDDDLMSIQSLRHIVLNGGMREGWTGPFELPFEKIEEETVKAALDSLRNGQQTNLLFKSTGAKYRVLDTEIDLGDAEYFFESVKLVNQEELEGWLKERDYSKPIAIIIEPGDVDKLTQVYPKFFPQDSKTK